MAIEDVDIAPIDDQQQSGAIQRQAGTEVAMTRAAQEVQASMVIAKKFPRDETAALARIKRACQRPALAEKANYAYPRGNKTVAGPSIRMAEVLAQNWGNLDFGIIELEQRRKDSTVMSYAWDLETNTRQTKVFTVKHERYKKDAPAPIPLKDPRDIYEMTANQGARRLRACILGVIPGDVVNAAVEECRKTLAGANKAPLADRIRDMAIAFQNEFGVTKEMLEKRLGHALGVTSEIEMVSLREIFTSLRDNFASVHDYFDTVSANDSDAPDKGTAIADRLKGKRKPQSKPEPEPQPEPEQPDPADAYEDQRASGDQPIE